MRILALTAEAFGGYGGIARSTQDLLRAIARLQTFRIEILPRNSSTLPGELPSGIRQRDPRNGRITFAAHATALALQIRPHLIYCGHLYMAPLAATLARVVGAKLAVHVHGLEIWQPLHFTHRKGLEQADLVYCVSEDTARRVHEATSLTASHTAVVFNTIGDQFRPRERRAARQHFGLSDETVLLTVSRLDGRQRHKGHELVIRLLPALQPAGANVADVSDLLYLIAGDGDDRARLEALAADQGVGHRVRFLGRVSDELLPALYSAADLYVMPSSGEGFGIAFVEAMCCGTPAFGLAIGGAPDALCHGTAVAPEAFLETLVEALAQPAPNRETLARATREQFGRTIFEARIAASLARLFPDQDRALALPNVHAR